MSHNRDEWLTRIKAIERQHVAVRFAVDHLLEVTRRDPTILRRTLEPRHLGEASEHLEATYVIRLFAEFESGLRHFWQVAKPNRRPRTQHLLDGVASARGIPNDLLVNAHTVRRYRNSLVHEHAEEVERIPIAVARGRLCVFFSRLPLTW